MYTHTQPQIHTEMLASERELLPCELMNEESTLTNQHTLAQAHNIFFPISYVLGQIAPCAVLYFDRIHRVVWIHMPTNRFTFILCIRSTSYSADACGGMWPMRVRHLIRSWKHIFVCSWSVAIKAVIFFPFLLFTCSLNLHRGTGLLPPFLLSFFI